MTCEVEVKGWSLAAVVRPSLQLDGWKRGTGADCGAACAVTRWVLDGGTVRGVAAAFWSALSSAKPASASSSASLGPIAFSSPEASVFLSRGSCGFRLGAGLHGRDPSGEWEGDEREECEDGLRGA